MPAALHTCALPRLQSPRPHLYLSTLPPPSLHPLPGPYPPPPSPAPHRAQPVAILSRDLINQRRNHAAGAAPGRPEVNLRSSTASGSSNREDCAGHQHSRASQPGLSSVSWEAAGRLLPCRPLKLLFFNVHQTLDDVPTQTVLILLLEHRLTTTGEAWGATRPCPDRLGPQLWHPCQTAHQHGHGGVDHQLVPCVVSHRARACSRVGKAVRRVLSGDGRGAEGRLSGRSAGSSTACAPPSPPPSCR